MEKVSVELHFYLMVNYRKHFGNEDLRQETELNVCMTSERALASVDSFQLLRLFTNAKSNVCCEIDTQREWIWHINIQKLSFLAFMFDGT